MPTDNTVALCVREMRAFWVRHALLRVCTLGVVQRVGSGCLRIKCVRCALQFCSRHVLHVVVWVLLLPLRSLLLQPIKHIRPRDAMHASVACLIPVSWRDLSVTDFAVAARAHAVQSVQTLRARNRLLSFVGIPHTGIVQLWMRAQLSRSLRSNSMKVFRAYDPLAALVRPTQALVRLVKAALLPLLPVRLTKIMNVLRAYDPLAALVRPTQALVRLVKAALLLLLPVRLLEAVDVVALHALSR